MADSNAPVILKARRSTYFKIERSGNVMELHADGLSFSGSGTTIISTGIKLYLKMINASKDSKEMGRMYVVQFVPEPLMPSPITAIAATNPVYDLYAKKEADKSAFEIMITASGAGTVSGRIGYLLPVSLYPATKASLDNG
jgi:hypothetical protein